MNRLMFCSSLLDQWKLIFHVNISDKLESNIKKTVKNTEEQIHEDSGSLKLLQKIQNKNKKMNIDEIQDGLCKLIDYGMVNRLLNNEVSIYGIGVLGLGCFKGDLIRFLFAWFALHGLLSTFSL
jgi:hypothetical protein